MTVVPGVSAAASSAFSVAMTDGSSMKTSPARRPLGRGERDRAVELVLGAERAERVEVRVQAPAADDVAARRRHDRAAGAGEQRAGEQERRADLLGEVVVDLAASRRCPSAHSDDLVLAAPLDARRRARASSSSIVCDVPDPRDVAEDDLVLGQDRRREDRERAVLVAGGHDGAAERHAALDDELLHERGRG